MKHIFLALIAFLPSVAVAQAVPPDLPAYVSTPATYAAGTALNVLGDGSTSSGGTPPAYAKRPRRVLSPIGAFATLTTAGGVSTQNCPAPVSQANPSCEMKFRTIASFNHINYDDPIRLYGKPGQSHCHEWAGNESANAFSTYTSPRSHPNSTVGGYWLNATAYWEPCMMNTATNTVVQPDNLYGNKFYYRLTSDFWGKITELPRGLRFIGGTNMDDPDDKALDAEIAAANAQAGTAGRYSRINNGVVGWQCILANNTKAAVTGRSDQTSPSLVNADGSDPWAGACVAGSEMYQQINGPECWDGVNLWSPTGYAHVRYAVTDHNPALSYPLNTVCPNHWYRVPGLLAEAFFKVGTGGFADYKNWRLSSDAMAAMTAGHAVQPGGSFHFDWMYGWDDDALATWEHYCLGTDGSQPHTCDYSTIDATHRMLSDSPSPDGRWANIAFIPYPGGVRDVPAGSGSVSGTVTGMHHGN